MSNMTQDGQVEITAIEDERFDVGPAIPHNGEFHCIKHGSNVPTITLGYFCGIATGSYCLACWQEQTINCIPQERE